MSSAQPSLSKVEYRRRLLDEVEAVRSGLVGPDGTDPAIAPPAGLEDDAAEMCAAVLAMPEAFRELGRSGAPLMWAWPTTSYTPDLSRREELLLAASLLLVAVERLDRPVAGRPLLAVVKGGES